ncbi:MAG: hypothetical protein F6K30_10675 [Cyanothece sp. SIO2G6]|nr:hypothetical protein [Cyanothece sp. SIO2G6]
MDAGIAGLQNAAMEESGARSEIKLFLDLMINKDSISLNPENIPLLPATD